MSDRTEILRQYMHLAGVSSFQLLSERTGVSRRAIDTLRKGDAKTLKYADLAKLASILQIDLTELIDNFINYDFSTDRESNVSVITALRDEYQRLQQTLANQQKELRSHFERETLQHLESLLLQLPSAAYAAQQNPNMLAKNILPLLRPLDTLLQRWEISVIGAVGAEVAYDPQRHQLMEGNDEIAVGTPVIIRYIGYMQGEKLLYRAIVIIKGTDTE
ncbi:MAG: helix-turn-helix domain-containing protein [Pseudanabaena sp.]|jgi:transcriptional regulator with XRE-family HTH domain|uniref:helix-turn-helix domain-containing protein n=1 Tax=Pseudanabaena mucicola TaxID=71190 RepID=UPI002578516A|nr:helix-turn-helix domain-containing protein [Pseudanabaena mucicola]MCA6553694.1 helix-turn-helix domain-containing protein [Pseudanabaena sp. M135S2SP2A07QC]MCA6572468.1 helix-turn-helix domain-containing protein [Pseudanabaena sp. M53BS1SP1A06MG]MCA6580792.1 helix-turn-helix domain-containing protein [Pseudanabaena sp. M34BS1SP1A06MG]MCA6587024.1 helix-turn-helix domain-containing protein [Pseudanabaena sp. M051S1SP1A06QC]MCA6589381.1 helix-turn-helix domain-containing protein [Pseudanabae